MRKYIAVAVVILAPVLASAPASAISGPEPFVDHDAAPLETDLITPAPVAGGDSIRAFNDYTGDPLQLIVWPNDTRRYTLGTDKIGVYVCTWAGATAAINLTDAVSVLNNQVTTFYYDISGGAYLPSFQARSTLVIDSPNSFFDCRDELLANASLGDEAVLAILDNKSNGGLATPGPSCFNSQNCGWDLTFPDNGRWAIIEGETVKKFSSYDPHVTTAAHEVGHTINFPHSYSGIVSYDFQGDPYVNEYDNPIDYMSGNMPATLDLGRRVEYPYSTMAFNRYRAGWVDPTDVIFYAGGVTELTLAPVGVDGTQMVILPTEYEYSLVTLDARISSTIDPIPSNFEGVTAHYVEQWWRNPNNGDAIEPVGGAASRIYSYPPSANSLNHVTRAGEEALLDVDQGEDLLAQGTLLKVVGSTADGFQIKLVGFDDVKDSVFLQNILWLADSGITKGCSDTSFCPSDYVTRGQMAAFLSRALGYSDPGEGNLFVDDDGSIFEPSIDRLATAGVTKGCNPPINDQFCPDSYVTREQMAAFLVRALGLTDDGGGNTFIDDDDSIFQTQIAILAEAGITKGCNPPDNTLFCPYDRVTREQMAAFLERAVG